MPGGYGIDMLASAVDSGLNLGVNSILQSGQQNEAWKLWNANNEYNTPLNQKKRFEAAGINPYAAMLQGQLTGGNSSSPAETVAPAYGDYSPGFSGMLDRSSQRDLNEATTRHLNSEASLNETDARTRNLRNVTEIANLKKSGLISDEEYQRLLNENQAFGQRLSNEQRKADDDHDLADFSKRIQEQVAKFAPKIQSAQLDVLLANRQQLLSAAAANDANVLKAAAEKAVAEAQKAGLEIDNETSQAIQDFLVDEAYQKSNEAYWRSRTERKKAGSTEHGIGVGPFSAHWSNSDSDPSANDPNHRRVYYDKHGPYIIDEQNQFKKIYLNGHKQ